MENITVPRGKTLYVAGGAVIYGHFTPGSSKRGPIITMEGDDAVLRGRGIIDGSQCPSHTRGILLVRGKHIRVEGVVLRDSSGWTLPMRGSEQVNISNVKIFGWRINSDGIDICGSRAVEVSGCYLRTWDDLVVVKTSAPGEGEARDITINKCVLWNERAHALSIGAELRKQVEHVRFTDCDIIRDKGHDWALRVFHCDAAQIRDVVFDDIRFDECQRFISLWIGKAKWSRDNERGHIDDITFKNIRVSGANPSIDCNGYDAEHTIHGIKFENVVINNKPLAAGDIRQNKFVSGVSLAP